MSVLRAFLTQKKNSSLFLYLIWTVFIFFRGKYELKKYSDLESITKFYLRKSGRLPNLSSPTLFSEKMQWIKLNHYDELMSICADKYEVRNWLDTKGYSKILNHLLAVYSSVEEINLEELPDSFVLKASHGSGWNLVVTDKNRVNWFLWKKILATWLKGSIFWAGREWVYKDLTPRIICEEYLEDKSGALVDYKFHCFHGTPKFVQANLGRNKSTHVQNFYDTEWNLQEFGKDIDPAPNIKVAPPSQLHQMIEISKQLSQPFLYSRVDFYEVDGNIIFGEITFFPAGGYPDFTPAEYDLIWGELLHLPMVGNNGKS